MSTYNWVSWAYVGMMYGLVAAGIGMTYHNKWLRVQDLEDRDEQDYPEARSYYARMMLLAAVWPVFIVLVLGVALAHIPGIVRDIGYGIGAVIKDARGPR